MNNRHVLAVLLAMLFMYQADATIVNVANPAIGSELGASGAQLQLVIGGYLLGSATLLIVGARLGQMYGYGRVFLVGVGVFGGASLACGLAPDPTVMIIARVVQGIGGALAFPQVLTAIQLHFDDGSERAGALNLYAIALAGGAVVGQLIGGLLVAADLLGLGWRPVFFVNVPIALAILLVGARVLHGDQAVQAGRRLDLSGSVTLASALLLIVLPLTIGREAGWPAWTWVCLLASVPLLTAFFAIERRQMVEGGSPLLNLTVIRRPPIVWGLWSQALAIASYYALLFTLALYLQDGLGYSALVSGLTLLPWVVAFGIPGRLLGRASLRAKRLLPAIGGSVLGFAYALISASMFADERSMALLGVFLAVGGLGLGTMFSSILLHLTVAATPRHASDISGVFTTSLQVAGAIGIATLGTLYLSLVDRPGPESATHAFAIVAALFALTALIASATAYRATRV